VTAAVLPLAHQLIHIHPLSGGRALRKVLSGTLGIEGAENFIWRAV
jgi:hypothetical protein